MSWKQLAKKAAAEIKAMEYLLSQKSETYEKELDDLRHYNRMASADIKDYNRCIDSVIAGQMIFCDWCADQEECTSEQKGHGCGDWMLRDQPQEILTGGNADES